MKLRFLTTYNEYGVADGPDLQYWDDENERWEFVDRVRMNERDYDPEEE